MVSFGIIRHQTRNSLWMKICTKRSNRDEISFSSNFGGKLQFHAVFLFYSWPPPLLLHIFSLLLPVQLGTMITLEPLCTECEFQHFILRFNKIYIYIYLADTTEREDKGWKHAQRQGEDTVTLEGKKNLYQFYQREFSRVVKPTWTYYFMFVRVCMLLLKTLEFISSSARFGIWSRTNSKFLSSLTFSWRGGELLFLRERDKHLPSTYLPT